MARALGFWLAALLVVAGRPARADDAGDPSPFGETAAKAQHVRSLGRLVWALTATCETGDDIARRQCRIMRDAAAGKLRGATLLVDVPDAVDLGAYDKAGKAVPFEVRGCVACGGLALDGTTWVVVGSKAAPTADGDKVRAAVIGDSIKPFRDEAAAQTWRAQVQPRLRTQMIIRVPDKKLTWTPGKVSALGVDIVGYRVIDACDGTVLLSSPEANAVAGDKAACGAVAPTKAEPTEVLPEELTKDQVREGLRPAVTEAQACFETYKIAGETKAKITIGGDGSVVSVELKGDFAGQPTGDCITTAIKKAAFPKSKRARTTISYPISLR